MQTVIPICYLCKHKVAGSRCSAYPKGIPEEIFYSRAYHLKVRKDQTGKDVFTLRAKLTDDEKRIAKREHPNVKWGF